jgi:hypothetical protein
MHHRISSLQAAEDKKSASISNEHIMRSPLDAAIIPWKVLSLSEFYTNQYRCKDDFLSVYKVITAELGTPTSICPTVRWHLHILLLISTTPMGLIFKKRIFGKYISHSYSSTRFNDGILGM